MLSCYFEDGDKAVPSLRHIAADGLVVRKNEILLVRRAPHLLEGGKFAIPGGYMNRDETTKEAALREVLEETGWKCKVKEFFGIADGPNRGDDRQNISIFFIMEPVEEVEKPDAEVTEVQWFPFDALPKPEEVAFDHYQVILAYKDYIEGKRTLPVFVD